jgi:hypothetical protein
LIRLSLTTASMAIVWVLSTAIQLDGVRQLEQALCRVDAVAASRSCILSRPLGRNTNCSMRGLKGAFNAEQITHWIRTVPYRQRAGRSDA